MTRLAQVSSVEPYRLNLTWEDGTSQTADLAGLIALSRHFKVFATDPTAFAKVRVVNWGHGLEWENGLDYSAENIKRIADEQQTIDSVKLLCDFQDRFGLTNAQAGRALGYKVSQIKNFRSGTSRISHSVQVAINAMMENPVLLYAQFTSKDIHAA